MAEVEIRGLRKRYGSAVAIDHLDLHIREGEFVTLLGPSGCGKTTTLRCIAGLEVPDAGEVLIGGQLASSSGQRLFTPPEKRDIGMVFQSYALWPHMTVFDNVAYPMRVRRAKRSEVRPRVEEMLELVGLTHLAGRSATALSGGQQQRVAVARALVSHPRLLLFDEPLSNLDATLRASMRTELRAIHARTGTTSICVTHDQTEALTLSDRVVVMNAGEVQQIGTPEAIFGTPANRFVAAFVGYDNFLAGTVAERGAGGVTVRLADTDAVLRCARPAGEPAPGAAVALGVRSSALQLSGEADAGAENALAAVVVDRAYLGESVQFTLEVGGRRLVVQVPAGAAADGNPADLRAGERATVRVPAGALVCFAGADPADGPVDVSGVTGLPLPDEDPALTAAS